MIALLVVEKTSAPKTDSPIAPADRGKFAVYLVRRTALHLAHQVGNRELQWHRYKHVDMIARQHRAQDVDLVLAVDLAAARCPEVKEVTPVAALKRVRLEVGGFKPKLGYQTVHIRAA